MQLESELLRDTRRSGRPPLGYVRSAYSLRSLVAGVARLTPVVDRRGRALVLDRPTSIEFVRRTAYVLSVTGAVYRVDRL